MSKPIGQNLDSTTSESHKVDVIFKETRILKKQDSIVVFGGESGFLKSEFGCDRCYGRVVDIYFSKEVGQVAFVDFERDSTKSKSYSISLYYWNNEKGYEISSLLKWDELFDRSKCDNFGPLIGSNYVEHNIGFNKKD